MFSLHRLIKIIFLLLISLYGIAKEFTLTNGANGVRKGEVGKAPIAVCFYNAFRGGKQEFIGITTKTLSIPLRIAKGKDGG